MSRPVKHNDIKYRGLHVVTSRPVEHNDIGHQCNGPDFMRVEVVFARVFMRRKFCCAFVIIYEVRVSDLGKELKSLAVKI